MDSVHDLKRVKLQDIINLGYTLNTLRSQAIGAFTSGMTYLVICADLSWWHLWKYDNLFMYLGNNCNMITLTHEYRELLARELATNVEIMVRADMLSERLLRDITLHIGAIGIELDY